MPGSVSLVIGMTLRALSCPRFTDEVSRPGSSSTTHTLLYPAVLACLMPGLGDHLGLALLAVPLHSIPDGTTKNYCSQDAASLMSPSGSKLPEVSPRPHDCSSLTNSRPATAPFKAKCEGGRYDEALLCHLLLHLPWLPYTEVPHPPSVCLSLWAFTHATALPL